MLRLRNISKILLKFPNLLFRTNPKLTYYKILALRLIQSKPLNLYHTFKKYNIYHPKTSILISISILGWLGFKDDDEEKESELILTLKRAVLCTQREQYDTAEQLLHIALKIAQEQQNNQGIIYCYDLMANLAFTQQQLNKSERLFIDVMRMLFTNGIAEDDLKIIHISLKLARIAHLREENERACLGYQWCLEQMNKKKENDEDTLGLLGVIHDWYSQFLLDRGDVKESLVHLKQAYKICCDIKGKDDPQSMLLLNDLGTTGWKAGDLEYAELCLSEAISIGRNLEDQSHLGVLIANLGVLYIHKGFKEMGKKYCKEAWQLGKQHDNQESMEQANYCFLQLKS
nr:tetratricopeptide repeat protein 19 homolog, mitochondrial-like [Onthophagus taurus]